jgi:hypothetical protein
MEFLCHISPHRSERFAEENNAKGVAARSFPAQFAIDWVKVYHCASDPATGRACIR